ncbi:MAG: phosphoglycerate kinase [Rikenellaceae bacterium]|nr:phosphoglycerate kinase [Rikenellaceae bacterium]
MASIETYDFKGKRAIIRVDFNVPLDENFNVTDDTRIRAAIPTIKKVLAGGGSVILMSHLGRPKEGPADKFSLRHIIPALEKNLGVKVDFADDCIGSQASEKAAALKPGQVLLLENLRFYKEEEKGDEKFAEKLASLADCYINDAFGTAHRAHASTTIIAKFFPADKMFGYVMEGELKAIDKVLEAPERPFIAILGGAKVSTKITIIEKLFSKVDVLIAAGGMTYTIQAALGGKIGKSMCEKDQFDTALRMIEKAKEMGVKLVLAEDAVCISEFRNDAPTKICPANDIPDGWEGVDIGPATRKKFAEVIESCKTILWNGPMGVFEMDNFAAGSKAVADAIAVATQKGAFSLIGGGDSVACINKFKMADKVSYNSTGGGALLEYIEGAELPGVAAIRK